MGFRCFFLYSLFDDSALCQTNQIHFKLNFYRNATDAIKINAQNSFQNIWETPKTSFAKVPAMQSA